MVEKIIKLIKWFIETFRVAISVVLVIMLLLALSGCTNLESLVTENTTDNSVKENTLLRIGEEKTWHIAKVEVGKETIQISAKVGEFAITTVRATE